MDSDAMTRFGVDAPPFGEQPDVPRPATLESFPKGASQWRLRTPEP